MYMKIIFSHKVFEGKTLKLPKILSFYWGAWLAQIFLKFKKK